MSMLTDSTGFFLRLPLLYSSLLYSTVLYYLIVYFTLLYCYVLYTTSQCTAILYRALMYNIVLYFTLPCCSVLYTTELYSTLLFFCALNTYVYSTLPPHPCRRQWPEPQKENWPGNTLLCWPILTGQVLHSTLLTDYCTLLLSVACTSWPGTVFYTTLMYSFTLYGH